MEEKERYEQYGYDTIVDNEVDLEDYEHSRLYMSDVINLLNQQDKEIKQLKEQVAELQKQLADKKRELKVLRILYDIVNNPKTDAMLKQIQGLQKKLDVKGQQIKKLQNQLKSQPAEILDKVYKYLTDEHNWKKLKNSWLVNGECEYLKIILKSILKEYGGKDE